MVTTAPRLTVNGNGTYILEMPIGTFKYRGGGWSADRTIGRDDFNVLVKFCKDREATMPKGEIMRLLAKPETLDIIFPNWRKETPRVLPQDLDINDKVKYPGKPYWGNGVVVRKLIKNVVVKFEFHSNKVRMCPSLLQKVN